MSGGQVGLMVIVAFVIFAVGFLVGGGWGFKGMRDCMVEDCEKLGGFYAGKRVFRCYEEKPQNMEIGK